MRKLTVISNSRLEARRKCDAFFGFRYAEGLEPELRPAPLDFGTMYHAGLERGWRAAWESPEVSLDGRYNLALGAYPEAIHAAAKERIDLLCQLQPEDVDALVEETERERETALWGVGHYFGAAKHDLAKFPIAIEHAYDRVPILDAGGRPNILVAQGRIDLVLWDHELRQVRVDDHKSTSGAVGAMERRLPTDTQMTGYVVVVRELLRRGDLRLPPGVTDREWISKVVGGFCFNVLRRSRPSEPKVNKLKKSECVVDLHRELLAEQEETGVPRGLVSVAQIDTTPEVYGDALLTQVQDRMLPITEAQRDRHAGLKVGGDTYFRQFDFYRGEDEIRRWRQEMWVESRRMREIVRDVRQRTRNPLACTLPWSPPCVYAAVCMDNSPEARRGFVRRQDRGVEVTNVE